MKTYGLLGQRLLQSLSPEIHRELGNFKYELFQLAPDKLDEFFKKREFAGLNVTTPYETEVIRYCDELTPKAKEIGSVDTITVDENGKLIGDNCEYDGFLYTLNKCGIDIKAQKVLIFGSGESARTVKAVVRDLGAREIVTVTEMGQVNYENFYEHSDSNIIIDTTHTGMFPHNGERLCDLRKFPDICGVIDLVYNPRRTRLICQAEDMNIPNSDSLSMLVAQNYLTEIKFGLIEPDDNLLKKTYKTMSDRRKNIIFVGLPGCGKTTTAKVVAAKLGRPCIDVDKLIEMKAGVPLSSIFLAYGEKYYRELESETLKKITRNGGQVISTESGVVLSDDNLYYLRQNGYIVWLTRDFDKLIIDGVYLSRNRAALKRIDDERSPIYREIADIIVEVNDNAEKTVSEVIERINIEQNPSVLF